MIDKTELFRWCSIPAEKLFAEKTRVPFRLVRDSEEMGELMARELADEILLANREKRLLRAIIPCGPNCWYAPFTKLINTEKISLRNLVVFHMDECLDWEGKELDGNDPYNFRSFMQRYFYGPVEKDLAVPEENRHFLNPENMYAIKKEIAASPIDITMGGWGQDGHIAYNQTRRNLYSPITIGELRQSSIRIQDNNPDTIIALGQRSFGAAYQFVPPMSITLGIKECLGAKKVRVYSDTGAWKQTAFRVALFSGVDVEYPITLLQEHRDALITATMSTARHPISEHPEWRFSGVHL